jgi:hypothetical protein
MTTTLVCDGESVGRFYRMDRTDREMWRWMIPELQVPMHGRSGGQLSVICGGQHARPLDVLRPRREQRRHLLQPRRRGKLRHQ